MVGGGHGIPWVGILPAGTPRAGTARVGVHEVASGYTTLGTPGMGLVRKLGTSKAAHPSREFSGPFIADARNVGQTGAAGVKRRRAPLRKVVEVVVQSFGGELIDGRGSGGRRRWPAWPETFRLRS